MVRILINNVTNNEVPGMSKGCDSMFMSVVIKTRKGLVL